MDSPKRSSARDFPSANQEPTASLPVPCWCRASCRTPRQRTHARNDWRRLPLSAVLSAVKAQVVDEARDQRLVGVPVDLNLLLGERHCKRCGVGLQVATRGLGSGIDLLFGTLDHLAAIFLSGGANALLFRESFGLGVLAHFGDFGVELRQAAFNV